MSFFNLLLLRSLRRSSSNSHSYLRSLISNPLNQHFQTLIPPSIQSPNPLSLLPSRSFAFSSAEEAAAERRRRKRRLRIEPPLHALRRDNHPPPPRDPNAPRLPDTTSSLTGPRLNLHNRVQSLIRAGDLDAASAVARHSVFSNTRPTVFTCNAIIAAMYREKRYNDVIALFQFFFNQWNKVPNVVSYNNLINAHCDEGRVDVGLEIYHHIIASAPFSPSSVTYRHLTKGLIDAGRIGEAVDLLREMLNKGHGADSLVYNNLIAGFLNLENLEKANELFDELKERCSVYDGVVNATFMDWFFNKGKEKEAMESYKSFLDRQFKMVPATSNVLLEVLLKHGKKTEAWTLFHQMLDDHTPPTFGAVNSDTFNIMVNECFKLGKYSEAIETFRKVGTQPKSRPFSMDVAGFSNIIARFCENGMMTDAETFYAEVCSKSLPHDATTHRTLIDGYLKAEQIDDVLRIFNRMVDVGLRVVASFGNRVFDELIKNGKAVDCAQLLTKMGERDPKPDVTSYEVVIRGLCNEGALDVSRELLDQMMRYGIGIIPALQEFVKDIYVKAGRHGEIERLMNLNKWERAPQHQPSGSPRILQSQVPPQMGPPHQPPSQIAEPHQQPPIHPQVRRGYAPTSPQGTGHNYPQSGGAYTPTSSQVTGHNYPQSGGAYTPTSPQVTGHNYPQSGGAYNPTSPQVTGHNYPQSGGAYTPTSPQVTGHNYPQSGGAYTPTSSQVTGHNYPQSGGAYTSTSPQVPGHNYPQSGGAYTPSSTQVTDHNYPQSGGAYTPSSTQVTGHNYPQSGFSQMTRSHQPSSEQPPPPIEELHQFMGRQ